MIDISRPTSEVLAKVKKYSRDPDINFPENGKFKNAKFPVPIDFPVGNTTHDNWTPGQGTLACKFEQLRWPSGKSVRLGSCRLGFDSESSQTNDFKIGIHSFPA